LQRLRHENIVVLYGVMNDKQNQRIGLLLEYADCGSLYNYLHRPDVDIAFCEKLNWMLQLANGMVYLHDQKTVHRDLKTNNLLLFDNYRTLKICDFGTVKQFATTNTEFVGTVCYMAPEVCVKTSFTKASDVYSFGVILWEIMYRKNPFNEFKNMKPMTIHKIILSDGNRKSIPQLFTGIGVKPNTKILEDKILTIMTNCCSENAKLRPTCEVLKNNIP
ncbi:hypothetical protein KR093_005537, partial [Drosophila rubida]